MNTKWSEFQFSKILFVAITRRIYYILWITMILLWFTGGSPWKDSKVFKELLVARGSFDVSEEAEKFLPHVHPVGRFVSRFNYYCALSEFGCHFYMCNVCEWAVIFFGWEIRVANSSTIWSRRIYIKLCWDRFQTCYSTSKQFDYFLLYFLLSTFTWRSSSNINDLQASDGAADADLFI